MKVGEKYLKGTIDLGVLGQVRILVLPNENREGNQPHRYVYINDVEREKLIKVGALWENVKQQREE